MRQKKEKGFNLKNPGFTLFTCRVKFVYKSFNQITLLLKHIINT